MTLIPVNPDDLTPTDNQLARAGAAANHYAQRGVFADYLARRADNTIRRHAADLARFADYLNAVGADAGIDLGSRLAAFADGVRNFPNGGDLTAEAWRGLTWGLVEGFRNWMVSQGDAINSINARLSAVKVYSKLAFKAGAIDAQQHQLIRAVEGYAHKEGKRLDDRRDQTRRSPKKAAAVRITVDQARQLKEQPDTAQGRRDALLMCLLIDHGLRAGEVAALRVSDIDLKAGEMRFYRSKVDETQLHKLTADTLRTLRAWFDSGDAPAVGPLLRGSRKGGALTTAGMTARAITERVKVLAGEIGIEGLSAHDCRHFWATFWSDKISPFQLKQAGGWKALSTVDRYVEASRIANEGMA